MVCLLIDIKIVRSPEGALHRQMAKQTRLEQNCVGDDLLFTVPTALQCWRTVTDKVNKLQRVF